MKKPLGRLMNKKEARIADALIDDALEAYADGDVASWVFVNASDDDEEENIDVYYDEDVDFYVLNSTFSNISALPSPDDLLGRAVDIDIRGLQDLVKQSSIDEQDAYHCRQYSWMDEKNRHVYNAYGDEYEEGEEEVYDDDGYGYDLDDELVPRSVSDRFGRQRLRKLGKRAYPKMNKSKRLPYCYNRPGCVYGKHGLGLKHSSL